MVYGTNGIMLNPVKRLVYRDRSQLMTNDPDDKFDTTIIKHSQNESSFWNTNAF